MSFLHPESNGMYLLKGPINTFISASYTKKALSNLRGRYDAKTGENADIFFVTASFLHTESSVIPLLKALIEICLSFPYTDSSEQLMRTL